MVEISGKGWELNVKRLGLHVNGARIRTYGSYQVYIEGQAQSDLAGFMCESPGPGDNKVAGNRRRIEPGSYPLWTHYGRYRSMGYLADPGAPGREPMPGFRLEGTGNRTAILVHPGHPPNLFLSSVGCLNPTNALLPNEVMNHWDSRQRVINLLESLKAFAPSAFRTETMARIANANIVVDGEPMELIDVHALQAARATLPPAGHLPISGNAARQCASWLLSNFDAALSAAVRTKIYKKKHLCAIVCQETAYKWLPWTGQKSTQTILERCVFDASGDYPGTSRSAFPKNTAEFRARYGDGLTNMLIEEANKTRRLQGWNDRAWVYKGYGIFQNDLQNITTDRAFFENKMWYDFGKCLDKACKELDTKLSNSGGDLWKAIRAYNGTGAAADNYMRNVKTFTEYCGAVTNEP